MNLGRKVFVSLIFAAFFYVSSALILPVVMGAILAALFYPFLVHLEKRNISTGIASALLTFGITVLILLPMCLMVFLAAKTGFHQLQVWRGSTGESSTLIESLLGMPKVKTLIVWVAGRVPVNMEEVASTVQSLIGSVWARLAELLGGVITQLPGLIVSLAVTVVSVYFFLVDGQKLIFFLKRVSFFPPLQTEILLDRITQTSRSVVLASVVSGGAQAFLEMATCILTGTQNFGLIGFFVFVASFIPIVGSIPVTIAVGIQQLLDGRETAGVILLIMAVFITIVDNLVRPLFLRGSANLHPLLAFIAAFGGLQTFGFLGVFVGPILAAVFVATVEILNEQRAHN